MASLGLFGKVTSSISPASPNYETFPLNLYGFFIDIGVNLVDDMFRGIYLHGGVKKALHQPDISQVLQRALKAGITDMLLTASCPADTLASIKLMKEYTKTSGIAMGTTMGLHPCQANLYSSESLQEMSSMLSGNGEDHGGRYLYALGEMGLDYDRLEYASKEAQLAAFEGQMATLPKLRPDLPLFLHMRSAASDFIRILSKHLKSTATVMPCVVHSFTDGPEVAQQLLKLHECVYLGFNGCSLRTEAGLQTARLVPLEQMLLESDAPWCSIKRTHACYPLLPSDLILSNNTNNINIDNEINNNSINLGDKKVRDALKGRNEPKETLKVAQVIAKIKGVSVEEVARVTYATSKRIFPLENT